MELTKTVVLDEFLVRLNNGPMAYHVVAKTVVKDGETIISQTLGTAMTMKQADAAGFSLSAVMSVVQEAALKERDEALDLVVAAEAATKEAESRIVAAEAQRDDAAQKLTQAQETLQTELDKPLTQIAVDRLKAAFK